MGRYSETTKEWVTVDDGEGIEYNVEVEVTRTEIRAGTYSSAALDPDEYYGEWRVGADVLGGFKIDTKSEEEYEEWLDFDELPDWVIYEAEAEYEE